MLGSPEILSDPKKMMECNKALADITPLVEKYKEYKTLSEDLQFIKENIRNEKDHDMREMMNEEQKELEEKLPEYEKELKILLLPKDENDDKNVIVEIRGEQVEMRLLYLLETYSECIIDMQKEESGK